jgi:hypothetical protein
MVTCGMTPIFMAFPELQTNEISYLDNAMNIVFGIDIILNFFTAYYDEDFIIVDENKVILYLKLKIQKIARDYLKSWFIGDTISVIPFEIIFEFGNLNRLARFSRLGKIYKVIKVSKLMRLVKSIKARNKMSKHLSETLKIN